MGISVAEIDVADAPEVWAGAGFTVDDDAVCRVGDVRIRLVGRERGTGIVGWSLRGLRSEGPLDGIPTTGSRAVAPQPAEHRNGVTAIDHIVVLSPDLGRTVRALQSLGVSPRRERDGELGGRAIRQVFVRFAAVIIEVVGPPDTTDEGPSTLWGITYTVSDIDASADYFGDRRTRVKDAVQPGRRITTLRHHDLGMSVRTALISAPILGG